MAVKKLNVEILYFLQNLFILSTRLFSKVKLLLLAEQEVEEFVFLFLLGILAISGIVSKTEFQ